MHTQDMTYHGDTDNYEGHTVAGGLVVIDRDTYEREREDLHIRELSPLLVNDPNWWVTRRDALLRPAPAAFFVHAAPPPPAARSVGAGTVIMLLLCAVPVLLILAALR